MARRTFFSFHYDNDISRANVVRNSWVTQDRVAAGFFDASLWEESKKKGKEAIEAMIDTGLKNTSVTAVLIGTETSKRDYVVYEIKASYKRGNGLLGVYIHNVKSLSGQTSTKGSNPFERVYVTQADGTRTYFSSIYPTYDWAINDGYENLGSWIEAAAKTAGK